MSTLFTPVDRQPCCSSDRKHRYCGCSCCHRYVLAWGMGGGLSLLPLTGIRICHSASRDLVTGFSQAVSSRSLHFCRHIAVGVRQYIVSSVVVGNTILNIPSGMMLVRISGEKPGMCGRKPGKKLAPSIILSPSTSPAREDQKKCVHSLHCSLCDFMWEHSLFQGPEYRMPQPACSGSAYRRPPDDQSRQQCTCVRVCAVNPGYVTYAAIEP